MTFGGVLLRVKVSRIESVSAFFADPAGDLQRLEMGADESERSV